MAGTLDDLLSTAVRTWATVARTWIDAANEVMVGWLDVADVESGHPGFNQASAVVPAQEARTPLTAGSFANWDQDQLPGNTLALRPEEVLAAEDTEILLRVKPPQGTASGTYWGSLDDPTGTCVLEDFAVYVVGDRSP
jgi:hypothetical protein